MFNNLCQEVARTRYEDYLNDISVRYNWWLLAGGRNGLKDALELMQQQYPGNYQVVAKQDKYNTFTLVLKFDNPNEELLWKLKWG